VFSPNFATAKFFEKTRLTGVGGFLRSAAPVDVGTVFVLMLAWLGICFCCVEKHFRNRGLTEDFERLYTPLR
jgi:hypothetical protein